MSAPPRHAVLEVEGLSYARGPGPEAFRLELPALSLARGDFVALVGESGSGKSTLLGLLGMLARPRTLGRFRLAGEEVAPRLVGGELDAVAGLRRKAIGFVLQQGGLLPFLTVADNLRLAAPAGGASMPADAAAALADRLGLSHKLGAKPGALSVGQRQRAAIARAVIAEPALILADEPTAALDPPTALATLELFREIAAELGTAVLLATHAWGLLEAFELPVVGHTTVESPAGPVARFAADAALPMVAGAGARA